MPASVSHWASILVWLVLVRNGAVEWRGLLVYPVQDMMMPWRILALSVDMNGKRGWTWYLHGVRLGV